MKTFLHVIVGILAIVYFIGCSSSEEKTQKKEEKTLKEVKASEIKVTKTNDNVRLEVKKHDKEIEADSEELARDE